MPIATPQGTLDFKSVDTITFVGASSNTVIDTTTGSLGVGVDVNGPTSNLHVVGNALITGNVAVTGTGALTVPSGTAEQQPTGVNGMIRYNSTTGYMEAYSAAGWGPFGFLPTPPPTIASISPLSTLVTDTSTQVFTVTGTGITNGSTIELVGADGTNYDVVDTTAPNAAGTQITFKLGDLTSATAQLANRPYRVKVNSTSGLSAITATGIGFSGIWTSPAAGASLYFSTTYSVSKTLEGTDAVGGTNKTFAVAPDSVSTLSSLGLSLDQGTGVLSGQIAAVSSSATNVTFRVIDTPSGVFEERTFGIVGTAELYAFASHTFTPCGVSAIVSQVRFGPTFAQMKTAYNSTVWYNTPAWFNEVSGKQGFQLWTVPKTGTYRITVNGAQGGRTAGNGSTSHSPGEGATIRGDFYFNQGTKLVIIVGQPGEFPTGSQKSNTAAGGGGATWVLKENFTTSNNDVYMVAGGGGGAATPSYSLNHGGVAAVVYNANGASQGVLGPGGAGGTSSSRDHGGAGGWTSNGTGTVSSGYSPHNGAIGGIAQDDFGGGYVSHGGFGGGGGNGLDSAAGGAGATGGAGASIQQNSGVGGTSYIMPTGTSGVTVTNRTFLGNHSNYDGSVYIQAPGTF